MLKITLSVKLLNATELTLCASTYNPASREVCLNKTYTEIVCCFYQMTFPVKTNVCNGASKSSIGLKSESARITLAGDIRVQGSLDCKSSFINSDFIFILFLFVCFLFV